MLIVTKALRAHAVANWGIKSDDTDADIRRRVSDLIGKGELTAAQLKTISDGKGTPKPAAPPAVTPPATPPAAPPAVPPTVPPPEDKGTDAAMLFRDLSRVRAVGPEERYDKSTKTVLYPKTFAVGGAKHPKADSPVVLDGTFNEPSQLDKAIAGVVLKAALQSKLHPAEMKRWHRWNDHDEQLWQYAVREKEWCGLLKPNSEGEGGIPLRGRKLNGEYEVKTLIADTQSGGLYAVPAAFDDAIILYPILYSQVFPHLNLQDVRSNRVQGATMARPTFTSGVVEGTGVAPFDTSGFISAFDTAIYNAQGGMEIGKDFEDDSPVAIGETVTRLYGEAAMQWLDRVSAYGNGVTEPQGMLRAAGLAICNSAFGAGGPMTVNDFQQLWFAVSKAFREEPGAYLSYLSNDTSYRNGRYIQIGVDDARKVLGMDWQSYTLGDNNYAIQNDIPDGVIGYFNFKRYNMYRRLGTQITIDDSGYQLRTRNTRLIVARMRFGGRLNHAGAGSVMTDAQAG